MKLKLPFNKTMFTIVFHKPFDISNPKGRLLERQRRISLTAFTSSIYKVIAMAIPLLTIKVSYDYLNAEVYGLWSTVTTFFALFAFSDLGLGNGLQTILSQANGKDDIGLCRKIISNTYIILLIFCILILVVFLIFFPFVNWASLMNAKEAETIAIVGAVVFVIVIPKIIIIPISIIQRTQLALQEGYRNDLWNICGALLSLVAIVLVAKFDLGKITLLAVSSIIPVLISLLNMFFFFRVHRKDLQISFKLYEYKIIKNLLSLGILFCLLSILTTIGLSMDTFIVARTCSLSEAGSYSIIYRISSVFSIVISIFSMPLWGANGEAISRGDIMWVKNNTRKMSFIMLGIAVFLSLIGLCCAKFIFKIWLGDLFEFSYCALFWLCCMQILLSYISPYFMLLNACGEVKKQIWLFLLYTPICFILKFYLSSIYGVSVVPMIGTILYLFIIVISIRCVAFKTLDKYNKCK